jgi:hypothetical protein
MYEELREWDKPLLEMFLKKLEECKLEEVLAKLKEDKAVTLCSGRSYDWVIWLGASLDEEEGIININLWKGVETVSGISDEMLESTSLAITNIAETLERAKEMIRELINTKLPEAPTHHLEEG